MVDCGGVRTVFGRARAPIMLCTLILGVFFLLRLDFTGPHQTTKISDPRNAKAGFGRLPIAFEPNQGQAAAPVHFLAHGLAYGLYLTRDEALLALPGSGKMSVVQMRFAGAKQDAEIDGSNPLPGHTNYLIGKDPSRWHRNIPQFSRVRYRTLYPGIDLDFYGREGQLEYDFAVNPGADFRQIQLDFSGAQQLRLAPGGDLLLDLKGHELRFQAPHIYQPTSSGNEEVSGNFVLHGNQVSFGVGNYDRSRMLIIDPVLTFSTYLGGPGDESCRVILGLPPTEFVPHCPAIAVDSAQRVYIAGATTNMTGFPAPPSGAASITPLGATPNVFVSRINSSGTALDFTTFIGGSGTDYPTGIGVDSGFNLYVAGNTDSQDFPTTPMAFQAHPPAAGTHVFVSKLDPTGSANLYSTYLAGSGTDTASSLAIDGQGREYIFGITTSSTDFPVTPGALQTPVATTSEFFFSKLDPTIGGSQGLEYSTLIGSTTAGGSGTVSGGAIAVDSSNPPNVYLAGGTNITDMPTVNAFETTNQGGTDVWVAKLTAPATNTQQYTPAFETYFGGNNDDIAYGVATDGTNTYVTGSTTSSNIMPATGTTPFQSGLGGGAGMDAFVAKFGLPTTTGTTQGTVPLAYFTYLGGSASDAGLAIVADTGASSGNVRVTGFTDSGSFDNSTLLGSGGGRDAFVARIVTNTTTTSVNTGSVARLGGSGTDIGTSIAEDAALNVYVAGETASGDFPTAAPPGSMPLQPGPSGTSDTFVSKLGPNISLSFLCNASILPSGPGCPTSPPPSNPTVSPTPVGVGNQIMFVYSIYNQGDPVTGAVFMDAVQGTNSTQSTNSTIASVALGSGATGTCNVASGGASAVCNLATINTSNTTMTTSGSTPTTSAAATVTVTVNATAPAAGSGVLPPKPPDVGNAANLLINGLTLAQASNTAVVNDFGIVPANGSNSATVKAGEIATYTLNVVPTGPIPESVTLSATGLPTGATATFAPSATIPNLNNGARSITLDIATTFRVTTPASLFRRGGFAYALWLPLSGLALIGTGVSRKRKLFMALACVVVLGGVTLQSACSSHSSNTSTTTGTPAGTYNITVNASSGSNAVRSTVVQLVVQ